MAQSEPIFKFLQEVEFFVQVLISNNLIKLLEQRLHAQNTAQLCNMT
jgi:hypothetical protein